MFMFHCNLLVSMSEKPYNFSCSLCGTKSNKAFSTTPKTFPFFLLHLNRKQRLRMKFKFPKFREGGFICCACYSRLYKDVRKWKLIGVDFSIICSLCGYEIQDSEKMVVPPCNDFRHSLHYDCCRYSLNGCPSCRKGLKRYLTTLRNSRSIRYLSKTFTILE